MKIGLKAVFFLCLFEVFVLPQKIFAGVMINEFSPVSSPEWVELYNPDDAAFSLGEITIFFSSDLTSSQKLSFCPTDQISGKTYKLITLSSSWLANTGDTLMLKKGDDIAESVAYGTGGVIKAPLATQSAFRTTDGWTLGAPSPQGEEANFNCVIPTPTPTPTPSPTASVAAVEIKISLDSKKYLDEKFPVKVEAKNLAKDSEFYVKLRGGTDETKLTKTRTNNNDAWLSDTESWSNFPLIKTNSDGNWSGEIFGMVDGEKETGKYKFRARFHNKTTESNYDSEIKEMEIVKTTPTVTPIITPTSTPKPTVFARSDLATQSPTFKEIELFSTSSGEVLGTESAKTNESLPEKQNPPFIAAGLILIGLSLILGSVVKYPHGIKIGGANP